MNCINTIFMAKPVAPVSNKPYSFGPSKNNDKGTPIRINPSPILLYIFVLAVAKKKTRSSGHRFGELDKST